MKVAYLLGSLNRGGTETLVLNVFKNLKNNQFDAIGFYRKTGLLEDELLNTNVPMIHIPDKRNYFIYLKKLRSEILKNKVTIIHAQQPLDAFNASIVCIGKKIPVVLTLHGYDFRQTLVSKIILKLILPLTNKNFYVSETQKNYYTKKYKLSVKNQIVVYNGVPFSDFNKINLSDKKNNLIRNELNIDKNHLLLGCVGNFNEVRDQIVICKFLRVLKEKISDFHFIFIGGKVNYAPDLFDNCVQYCESNDLKKNVSFLGSRSDVFDILPQLDSFIYATNHDTFGIAVIEAMSAKIPVFVNDWGVMNEVTDNGQYATLYKTKDENDLLLKFMLFLQNKSPFIQKAKSASEYVKTKFSIHKHIENLFYEYELLINNNSK